jgi:hypothetical protein
MSQTARAAHGIGWDQPSTLPEPALSAALDLNGAMS